METLIVRFVTLLVFNEFWRSTQPQRRNIEILKIRFGEAALQVCEVMLRDMTDSRRIDQHVQSQKSVSDHDLSQNSKKVP